MENNSSHNWESMVLTERNKKSFSPMTPKEDWQEESNMELLKKRLLQFHNVSEENIHS